MTIDKTDAESEFLDESPADPTAPTTGSVSTVRVTGIKPKASPPRTVEKVLEDTGDIGIETWRRARRFSRIERVLWIVSLLGMLVAVGAIGIAIFIEAALW